MPCECTVGTNENHFPVKLHHALTLMVIHFYQCYPPSFCHPWAFLSPCGSWVHKQQARLITVWNDWPFDHCTVCFVWREGRYATVMNMVAIMLIVAESWFQSKLWSHQSLPALSRAKGANLMREAGALGSSSSSMSCTMTHKAKLSKAGCPGWSFKISRNRNPWSPTISRTSTNSRLQIFVLRGVFVVALFCHIDTLFNPQHTFWCKEDLHILQGTSCLEALDLDCYKKCSARVAHLCTFISGNGERTWCCFQAVIGLIIFPSNQAKLYFFFGTSGFASQNMGSGEIKPVAQSSNFSETTWSKVTNTEKNNLPNLWRLRLIEREVLAKTCCIGSEPQTWSDGKASKQSSKRVGWQVLLCFVATSPPPHPFITCHRFSTPTLCSLRSCKRVVASSPEKVSAREMAAERQPLPSLAGRLPGGGSDQKMLQHWLD